MMRHVTRDTDLRLVDRAERAEPFLRAMREDMHELHRIEARQDRPKMARRMRDDVEHWLGWSFALGLLLVLLWFASAALGPTGNDIQRAKQAQTQHLQQLRKQSEHGR